MVATPHGGIGRYKRGDRRFRRSGRDCGSVTGRGQQRLDLVDEVDQAQGALARRQRGKGRRSRPIAPPRQSENGFARGGVVCRQTEAEFGEALRRPTHQHVDAGRGGAPQIKEAMRAKMRGRERGLIERDQGLLARGTSIDQPPGVARAENRRRQSPDAAKKRILVFGEARGTGLQPCRPPAVLAAQRSSRPHRQ